MLLPWVNPPKHNLLHCIGRPINGRFLIIHVVSTYFPLQGISKISGRLNLLVRQNRDFVRDADKVTCGFGDEISSGLSLSNAARELYTAFDYGFRLRHVGPCGETAENVRRQ